MSPLLIAMIAFLAVTGLIGLVAFVFRDTTPQAASRLDMLIGKRRREDDEKADILRKSALRAIRNRSWRPLLRSSCRRRRCSSRRTATSSRAS